MKTKRFSSEPGWFGQTHHRFGNPGRTKLDLPRLILFPTLMLLLMACAVPPPAAPPPTPTTDPIAMGQAVSARVCAECHGAQAEGHAYLPAPALNGNEHAWHHPDIQIREWIKNGKLGMAQMPAYGDQLTDAEVEAVIVYIKSLWPEEKRAFQEDISRRYPTPAP